MSTKTLISAAEFDALPEREGFKVELSEGELVMTASPYLFHNRVRDRIGRSLGNYAEAHGLGEVIWEIEYYLAEATIRIPDISFVRAERMAAVNPHQRLQPAPDLAVEVVSPSNSAADMARKVRQYLASGARLVWVIYPEERQVYIYRPGERPEIREGGQTLDAPELLPGWSLPLPTLFGEKK